MGLLLGIFCQILTEFSARDMPIFSFPDDILSKRQMILTTKLGTCIDIKEIWLGIGQISSIVNKVYIYIYIYIYIYWRTISKILLI